MNIRKLINMSVAVMASLSLAVYPAYAQEVSIGEHIIDVSGIEHVCENPTGLDSALTETYNELLTENPEVAEFFATEVTELAEMVSDIPLEEATVEVVETVAEVTPQLVQSIAPTQERAGLNTEMAGMIQDFLTTAPDVLAGNPEMVGMLGAVEQQLEFLAANETIQQAGFENIGDFMQHIMQESGGASDAMMNSAREIFSQHGGEFMPMFENGVPEFMTEHIGNMGNFFEAMETHGQEMFAGGEFDPARMQEVMGAAFEGQMPEGMMEMMQNFAEGGEFPGEFSPEMMQGMMEHMEGEFPVFGEGPLDAFQPGDGEWVFDMPEGMVPPEGFEAAFTHEFEQYAQEFEQQIHEYENNMQEEQINNMNQDMQEQMGGCVEHYAAPAHDKNSDGHGGCP